MSRRDIDFIVNRDTPLQDVMTPFSELVTGLYPLSIQEASKALKESKKGYLPIIDSAGNLKALTTRSDLKKKRDYPHRSQDSNGKLLVGAAVKCTLSQAPGDMERVRALAAAGCDIVVLDAQNGDNQVGEERANQIYDKLNSNFHSFFEFLTLFAFFYRCNSICSSQLKVNFQLSK